MQRNSGAQTLHLANKAVPSITVSLTEHDARFIFLLPPAWHKAISTLARKCRLHLIEEWEQHLYYHSCDLPLSATASVMLQTLTDSASDSEILAPWNIVLMVHTPQPEPLLSAKSECDKHISRWSTKLAMHHQHHTVFNKAPSVYVRRSSLHALPLCSVQQVNVTIIHTGPKQCNSD